MQDVVGGPWSRAVALLGLSACGTSGPSTVTLTLLDRPTDVAAFKFVVAYQDGDGPWQAAPAPHGDDYVLPVASPRYAVAWTCPSSVTSVYTTVAEQDHVTAHVADDCTDQVPMVTLSGTVMMYNANGPPIVWFGDHSAITTGSLPYYYELRVPAGMHDLVATDGGCDMHHNNCDTEEVAIVRNVNAQVSMAFDQLPNASVPSYQTVGAASVNANTTLYTAGGTAVSMASVDLTEGFQTRQLDHAQSLPGDIYVHQTQAMGVTHEEWKANDGPFSPQPSSPPATPATATRDHAITITWAAPMADGYEWNAHVVNADVAGWSGTITPGYVAGGFTLHTPDLSAIAGWNPALALDGMVTGDVAADITRQASRIWPWAYPAADGTVRDRVAATWMLAP